MTTTVMKDSIIGDNWIYDACMTNPVQRVLEADGSWTGNILSGPVRLAWIALLKQEKKMKSDANSAENFHVTMLFPPWADLSIFEEEYHRIAQREFPSYPYNEHTGGYTGLRPLFTDCAVKANQYEGYTPGLMFAAASSQYKPSLVNGQQLPIVDANKVYPGVWGIVAVNMYAGGKNFPQKGPMLGLQSVMLIGDDKNLGGGAAADPKKMFSGVSVKPPITSPSASFARAQNGPQGQAGGVGTFQRSTPPAPPPPAGAGRSTPPAPGRPAPPPPPGRPAADPNDPLAAFIG